MESNDGVIEDGQVIFDVDEFDMDLLQGAEADVSDAI
jgi:hypothetical protein